MLVSLSLLGYCFWFVYIFDSSKISNLIQVYRVQLSANLSGFVISLGFRWNGSCALGGFLSFISNFNFILCMKLFTSLRRCCIVRFFGSGMKVRPLRSIFFVSKIRLFLWLR